MKDNDPRITDDYIRRLSCEGETELVLVGAVHDHPASKYRVRTVVEEHDPDALAVELPPLAVPLFQQYANDTQTPPRFGGEMSAAIQVASTDRVVGIDGPTPRFTARLAKNLYRDGASRSTARNVGKSLLSVTKHAFVCRCAAVLDSATNVRLEVDSPVTHDCDWSDEPQRQAEDEQGQIRQARSIMNAFEPTKAARFRKETREGYMVDRLSTLRQEGELVAVIGIDHLDTLAESLADTHQ